MAPDPDATLDLEMALQLIYVRSLYHLSIDYEQTPPPPVFDEVDMRWMRAQLAM